MKIIKKYLLFLIIGSLIALSCGKNYHDGKYDDSDEYINSLGTSTIRKTIMDSVFYDAMIDYMKKEGIIKNESDLDINIIRKMEKLVLSTYGIPTKSNSLKGVELFISLKELDIRGANPTSTSSFERELKRIRKRLDLDTTKIYTDYNIVWGVL